MPAHGRPEENEGPAAKHPPYFYPWLMALVGGALLGPVIGSTVAGVGALVLPTLPFAAAFGVVAASASFGMGISLRWAGPWRAALGGGVGSLVIAVPGLAALLVIMDAPVWTLAVSSATTYACAVVATRILLHERYD